MTDYCIDPTHSMLEAANSKLHGEILQYRSRLEEESKRAVDAEAMELAWMEQIADLQASLKKLCDERNALVFQVEELRNGMFLLLSTLEGALPDGECFVELERIVKGYTEKPKGVC